MGFILLTIHSYNNLQGLAHLKKDTQYIQNISLLINSLQKERGYSSGYLGSHGVNFQTQLLKQQQSTDKLYTKILSLHKRYAHDKKMLQQLRKEVQTLSLNTIDGFERYTQIIKHLLHDHITITKTIEKREIAHIFYAYTHLLFMKEATGKIRGSLNGVFSQKEQNYQLIFTAIHAKGEYTLAEQQFLIYSSDEIRKKYQEIIQGENYLWLQRLFDKYTKNANILIKQNPHEWFEKATVVIESLNNLEKLEFASIDAFINRYSHQLQVELATNIVLFFLIALIMLTLGLKIKNSILRNLKILSEYKHAVDRSSIVSKTDKHGKIIYVNDKFCAISGYSKEELLGKSHNIVRHQDMPKSAFANMWHTILNKKAWSGVIKNRKKDGNFYIVEVTISPILNEKGEIEEFIAIRNDITQILELHKEIEETQEDIILKMGEIGETRSQETGFHVKRVAVYSQILAKYYGLDKKEIQYLTIASPMHDIGKVAIPDNILHKAGKLTQEEWEVMQTHAQIGYELFNKSERELLKTAAIIAHEHHEKYDGSGYPRGLRGEEIHIYGRITALADVFDALGSERCYKKAWDDERVFKLIKEERGKHFDPKLVDIFFQHLDEFLHVREKYKEDI